MDDLPTPEELGDKLKAGEITREEAIEVMSERARREAFRQIYGQGRHPSGGADEENASPKANPARRVARWGLFGLLLALLLAILFWLNS